MSKTLKNAKYFIYDVPSPESGKRMKSPKSLAEARKKGQYFDGDWLFTLDSNIIPGALYTNGVWLTGVHGAPFQIEQAHTHDYDETLGFVGTVPGKPHELGGEIELWMENEKYLITKSCLIFVPKGKSHMPMVLHRIDSPIFFLAVCNNATYTRETGAEELE
jgi:hypothetical protein